MIVGGTGSLTKLKMGLKLFVGDENWPRPLWSSKEQNASQSKFVGRTVTSHFDVKNDVKLPIKSKMIFFCVVTRM